MKGVRVRWFLFAGMMLFASPASALTIVSGNITTDTTWTGDVYEITNDISVNSGATLTIHAGTIVKFDVGKRLSINNGATLNAEGTEDSPIYFTSIKDDSIGGDTNGDGDGTFPRYLDQWGINAYGTVSLAHVVLRYGFPELSVSQGTTTVSHSVLTSTFTDIQQSGGTLFYRTAISTQGCSMSLICRMDQK